MQRRSLLAACVAAALAPAARAQALPARFDPGRNAAADVQEAITRARAQGKKVLVDVGGEWCTWCHILDRFIASHPQVQRALDAQYVAVKVNYSPQNKNAEVLGRWPKVAGYPHLFVLDASGALLVSQSTAEFERGNDYDEAKLIAFLNRYGTTVR